MKLISIDFEEDSYNEEVLIVVINIFSKICLKYNVPFFTILGLSNQNYLGYTNLNYLRRIVNEVNEELSKYTNEYFISIPVIRNPLKKNEVQLSYNANILIMK